MSNNIAEIPKGNNALTPMDMLEIAVSKGTDLDQLTKLMDLQERWEANEAKKAFVAALGAFKENPPELTKNKEVGFGKTSYAHATLDNVSGIVGASLSKHDIAHRWAVEQTDKEIKVTCILTHVQGHSESTSMQAPSDTSGSKNSIQAIGSTVTYLERYTLLAAVGLATKDMDKDGGAPAEFITAEQKSTLIELIKKTGADTAGFLRFLKVESLDQLERARFDAAVSALNNRGKK